MAQVDWDHISEAQYEQTVSILLSRMHPTSRRIDGSGGDCGRDVQFEAGDGLNMFQLKSFTGRLDKRRRKQIVDSVKTAAALNPTDWVVIVPIDPTPKELEWCAGLRATVAFPIEYPGRTWLDAEMSAHPEIGRYVLEDAANEIVRLAQDLNQERAVLAGGASDALDRAGAVADQLKGLDPHYRYEITVGEGKREVRIMPRYEGAEVDRPIEGPISQRRSRTRGCRSLPTIDRLRRTSNGVGGIRRERTSRPWAGHLWEERHGSSIGPSRAPEVPVSTSEQMPGSA